MPLFPRLHHRVGCFGQYFVSDGTNGRACVQKDSVWVNDVGCWCVLCDLGHGEFHLWRLWSNTGVGCWLWKIYCITSCFLTAIVCNFWKWSPIVFWYCLVFLCITTFDECNCCWGRLYLAWWRWCLVTKQYVVCSSCGFGLVVCAQKGDILQVVPDPWVSVLISRHE